MLWRYLLSWSVVYRQDFINGVFFPKLEKSIRLWGSTISAKFKAKTKKKVFTTGEFYFYRFSFHLTSRLCYLPVCFQLGSYRPLIFSGEITTIRGFHIPYQERHGTMGPQQCLHVTDPVYKSYFSCTSSEMKCTLFKINSLAK